MYFTYLNLPAIPKYIEDQILYIAENPKANFHNSNDFVNYIENNRKELNISADKEIIDAIRSVKIDFTKSLGYPLSNTSEYFSNLAQFDFLEVNEEIKKWVKANIDRPVIHISVQCMYGGTTITPHIDEMRSIALNYIVSTGGESKTCFYKAKKEYQHLTPYPQTVFPFDRLELLQEVQIESHRWHHLDVSTIHSVENINPNKKRISLSLSLL